MARWVRLWGKKRGSRMSGWWVVGSLGEAAFHGILFLLGIASLTTIVSWQVFWPESSIIPIGFGFWLMVIASGSFVVIGLTAFILRVSQTLASPEQRSVLVDAAKREHQRRAEGDADALKYLPSLKHFTDSPGVELAYRLASQNAEKPAFVLGTMLAIAWNAMLAIFAVLCIQGHLSGRSDWLLTALLVPFAGVSVVITSWFFRLFRKHLGVGPTAVEVEDLPLIPGGKYQLYLCQYGKCRFKKLTVSLVAYEQTTYDQGTDIRTERQEVLRIPALCGTEPDELTEKFPLPLVADPERPLELYCHFSLPFDMMHSFQGEHNAVLWKVVVEGEAQKWPSFCRSFPVVVYPRDAR